VRHNPLKGRFTDKIIPPGCWSSSQKQVDVLTNRIENVREEEYILSEELELQSNG